jgi:hypothetical protein
MDVGRFWTEGIEITEHAVCIFFFCHVITFEIRLAQCIWRLLLYTLYTRAVLAVCTSSVSSEFCLLHCVPVYAHFVEFIYVQYKAIKRGNGVLFNIRVSADLSRRAGLKFHVGVLIFNTNIISILI